jgi:hypothetical protein
MNSEIIKLKLEKKSLCAMSILYIIMCVIKTEEKLIYIGYIYINILKKLNKSIKCKHSHYKVYIDISLQWPFLGTVLYINSFCSISETKINNIIFINITWLYFTCKISVLVWIVILHTLFYVCILVHIELCCYHFTNTTRGHCNTSPTPPFTKFVSKFTTETKPQYNRNIIFISFTRENWRSFNNLIFLYTL